MTDPLKAKLRDRLTSLAYFGGGMDDYGSPDDDTVVEEVEEVIEFIDQAYKEAGYVTIESVIQKGYYGMTGQEFYERFMREYRLLREDDPTHYLDLNAEEAAKRAAGLDDADNN